MALGSTQPLVKRSTRNIPGGKGGQCARLTTSPPSRVICHEIWVPKPPGTLWATLGLLWDSFIFFVYMSIWKNWECVIFYVFISFYCIVFLLQFSVPSRAVPNQSTTDGTGTLHRTIPWFLWCGRQSSYYPERVGKMSATWRGEAYFIVSLGCLWDDDDVVIMPIAGPYFWSPKFIICAQVTCVIVPHALLAISLPNVNIPEEAWHFSDRASWIHYILITNLMH